VREERWSPREKGGALRCEREREEGTSSRSVNAKGMREENSSNTRWLAEPEKREAITRLNA